MEKSDIIELESLIQLQVVNDQIGRLSSHEYISDDVAEFRCDPPPPNSVIDGYLPSFSLKVIMNDFQLSPVVADLYSEVTGAFLQLLQANGRANFQTWLDKGFKPSSAMSDTTSRNLSEIGRFNTLKRDYIKRLCSYGIHYLSIEGRVNGAHLLILHPTAIPFLKYFPVEANDRFKREELLKNLFNEEPSDILFQEWGMTVNGMKIILDSRISPSTIILHHLPQYNQVGVRVLAHFDQVWFYQVLNTGINSQRLSLVIDLEQISEKYK